jgi:hypothetical protein
MKPIVMLTPQTVWDCRWSRAGYRITGVAEEEQPESVWVCIRQGYRRAVRDEECEGCPDWEADDRAN